MAVQKLITKLQRTRVTVGNYVGALTHPIYLGMPPLPINIGGSPLKGGATNASPVSFDGVSKRSIKVRNFTRGETTNIRPNFGSDEPSVQGGTRRTKSKLPGNGSKSHKSSKKKTSSKKILSGIRVITGRGGRKVYMKNGKFVKKPGGK